MIPIPELLAPAGSLEALEVAVKNGADAVYFGLDRFSARSAAKNLTLEQLPAAIRFLHEHSARGYLALNTLLRNDELPAAIDLARELLAACQHRLGALARMSLKDLQRVKGIGPAKAVTIKAALQMGVLLEQESFDAIPVIRNSKDLGAYLKKKLQFENREVFLAGYLNRTNRVLGMHTISTGGIEATIADVRIILKKAIEEQASSIVLSHNHPSGNLRPSQQDRELTRKIREAARLIDVKVLDHIIVSDQGYYSFADEGLMD